MSGPSGPSRRPVDNPPVRTTDQKVGGSNPSERATGRRVQDRFRTTGARRGADVPRLHRDQPDVPDMGVPDERRFADRRAGRARWPNVDLEARLVQVEGAVPPTDAVEQLAVVSVEAGLPRLTTHGLRHTSATLILANGVPPEVAAERHRPRRRHPLHQPLRPRHADHAVGRRRQNRCRPVQLRYATTAAGD
jgi:hypothetical protein